MKRLGRGLADLIDTSQEQSTSHFVTIQIDQIKTGKFQPRGDMSQAGLDELKESIKRSGVIEPIIVRSSADGSYELVAGERRLRASQAVGMKDIPAIVRELSDKEAVEFSLVENIQRENLNPLEEAKGYARLLDEFGYTQEDIAAAVGKDRTTVANFLRLLALPEEIQHGLRDGVIAMGHAKALLGIGDAVKQRELYHRARSQQLSVRQVEALVVSSTPARQRRIKRADPQLKGLEDELRRALGTKVTLSQRKKGGRITVEYFSQEDLTRIFQLLTVSVTR